MLEITIRGWLTIWELLSEWQHCTLCGFIYIFAIIMTLFSTRPLWSEVKLELWTSLTELERKEHYANVHSPCQKKAKLY